MKQMTANVVTSARATAPTAMPTEIARLGDEEREVEGDAADEPSAIDGRDEVGTESVTPPCTRKLDVARARDGPATASVSTR